MNYIDRQKQVIWTSPSGKRFVLLTDGKIKFSRKRKGEVKNNPTRSYGKNNSKTSYKTVNMSDDTFQDMGVSGRDFSLKIYFLGDNHDIEAQNFDVAYCERGQGKLQLTYGNIMTVQALDIDYDIDTVEKSSMTVINISFHECGRTVYPTAKESQTTSTKKNINQALETVSQSFGDTVEKLADKETFAAKWATNLDKLTEKFEDIQNSDFISILNDIKSQNILDNSYIMSTQLGILLKKGFLAYNSAYDMLDSVDNLLSSFLPSSKYSSSSSYSMKAEYTADDIFAKQTIIAAADVFSKIEFEVRKDAVNAVQDIQDINDNYIEKSQEIEQVINENLENAVINEVDTNDIVNNVISSVVNNIDDLKIEKTVCLKELSNPLMLAYQYYPDLFKKNPDDAIAYLNKTNNFCGDDFLYLEKGRKVVIYV